MAIIPRLWSILFLLSVIAPFVASTSRGGDRGNCRSNEFWHEDNQCCLRRGGPPSPPPPPRGANCPPHNWYWGSEQGCCLPRTPPPSGSPPPQCPEGWKWYPFLKKCLPRPTPPTPHLPQPSGHGGHGHGYGHGRGHGHGNGHGNDGRWRRDLKSRSDRLCPSGLDACPIAGSLGDYECIDVANELESCGGCASVGQGQDCTAIPGVWNVGCEQGACAVYSCSFGYKRSHDGTSCVPF